MAGLRFCVRCGDGKTLETVQGRKYEEYIIGRKSPSGPADNKPFVAVGWDGNRLFVADKFLSRKHCRVYWDDQVGWMVEDLQSANGTIHEGGEQLLQPTSVGDGIVLHIGTTVLKLEPAADEGRLDQETVLGIETSGGVNEPGGDHTLFLGTPSQKGDRTLFLGTPSQKKAPADSKPDPVAAKAKEDISSQTIRLSKEQAQRVAGVDGPLLSPAIKSRKKIESQRSTHLGSSNADLVQSSKERSPEATEDAQAPIKPTGLSEILLNAQLLTPVQVQRCLVDARNRGNTFFRTLVTSVQIGVSEERLRDICRRVAKELEVEYLEKADDIFSRAVVPDWLPFGQAERLRLFQLNPNSDQPDADAQGMRYATIDPSDITIQDWVARHIGQPVPSVLIFPRAAEAVLRRIKQDREEKRGYVIDIPPAEMERIRNESVDVNIPERVDAFLQRAVSQGASDVHVEPTEHRVLVRTRIDGVLHEEDALPLDYRSEMASRIKIMSKMDVAEKRRPQDGRIGIVVRSRPIDIRVSTYPTVHGEKIVMRLLDQGKLRPTPESLGFVARDLQLLSEKIQAPFGLVMLCGPTGSGKTTTLYSCLSSIDKTRKNVLTIEDPVEYRLEGVHQMQINPKIGLTFAAGLRTILRQDPDVIMVGECRDSETAEMAVQAALTGHIVFSTIHTNDAVGVVTRLIDLNVEPFLVASALSLTIAQRLVRTICENCKVGQMGREILMELAANGVSEVRLKQLGIEIDASQEYAYGEGCDFCRGTGYAGRKPVFEVFEPTKEVRQLITSGGVTAEALRGLARKNKMTTLISHGIKHIEEGETTFYEVIRVLGESF